MILGLVVVLAGAALLAQGLVPSFAGRRRLATRARKLARARTAPAARAAELLVKPAGSRLDALAQRLLPKPDALRARLEATGLPIGMGQYGLASLGAAVGCGTLTFIALGSAPLALMSALGGGLFVPHTGVGFLMGRRRGRFTKVFAEAIALIVRGLRAGLPVTEAIGIVGREIADPVGEEFRHIADQVRLGLSIEDAMWQAARRINLPEFNFLVISLSVQRETGGNLAETLENLEHILRRRQQMKLKIKAMSSEATASALIIGSLPFVMGILMSFCSPDYLHTLFVTPLGRLLLMGGGVSLVSGSLIMRQMVRFEI